MIYILRTNNAVVEDGRIFLKSISKVEVDSVLFLMNEKNCIYKGVKVLSKDGDNALNVEKILDNLNIFTTFLGRSIIKYESYVKQKKQNNGKKVS